MKEINIISKVDRLEKPTVNKEGLPIIFKNYFEYLCSAANKIVGDRFSSEDIVQEIFADIIAKHQDLANVKLPKQYLKRAVINRSLNFIRDRHTKLGIDEIQIESYSLSAQGKLESQEAMSHIHNTLDRLPPRCYEVFKLSRFENLSYKEIAEELNISVKTVENHISNALKFLRYELT